MANRLVSGSDAPVGRVFLKSPASQASSMRAQESTYATHLVPYELLLVRTHHTDGNFDSSHDFSLQQSPVPKVAAIGEWKNER